jgi:DNA-binding PadR family transcriptional regulator
MQTVYPYICWSHLDLLAILWIVPFKREWYSVKEIQTMFRIYKHKNLTVSTIYKMISDLNKQDLISKNKVTYMNSERTYYSLKWLQEFTPPVETKEPAKSFLSWFLWLWKRKN